MGILSWALLGLIAGAIAKMIHPGPDGDSWFKTMLLGIGGAFVGGFIGGSVLGMGGVSGFDLRSLGLAVAGSLILLWGSRKLRSRSG